MKNRTKKQRAIATSPVVLAPDDLKSVDGASTHWKDPPADPPPP